MQIAVNSRQLRIRDALREHIETSITEIAEKYFGNPLDASVTLSREGGVVRSDIAVHVGRRMTVHGQGRAEEAEAAFENAAEKIAKQLRRFKRRLRDHHNRTSEPDSLTVQQTIFAAEPAPPEKTAGEPAGVPAADGDGAEDGEWRPIVIAEMAAEIETLTVEEAVMHLDLGTEATVMFRNSAHGEMNVVFRRSDGNIGWIDPKESAK